MNTEREQLGGELVEQSLIPGVQPQSETARKIASEVKRREAKRSATVRRSAVIGHGELFETARPAGDLFDAVDKERAENARQVERSRAQLAKAEAAQRYGALYCDFDFHGGVYHPCGELGVWRGVVFIARYNPEYFTGLAHVAFHQVHPRIEERPHTWTNPKTGETITHEVPIRCTDAQPFTETGYRSTFVKREVVEQLGGPAAFIVQQLDAAAKSNKRWAKAHP